MTLEARVSERTRIARELHDTLLQSFHGLLLRFQTVLMILPERPEEARRMLESALDQAAAAITEGRDAVQGLRSSAFETNDLANAITAIAEELTSDTSDLDSPAIDVEVEGVSRNLNPVVRDEACRIAGEALRNASVTHRRGALPWRFFTTIGSSACASAMTERASMRRFYAVRPPDTWATRHARAGRNRRRATGALEPTRLRHASRAEYSRLYCLRCSDREVRGNCFGASGSRRRER